MCLGIIILGLGVALLKLSLMGNDPCCAMIMGLEGVTGIAFSKMFIMINAIFFLVEIVFGRKYIGLGTFVNWLFVGVLASFYGELITGHFTVPEAFMGRLVFMIAGVLLMSLAVSMYQTADVGIAPYDCLSLLMNEKFHIPYFWCRMATDAVCTVIAFSVGGIVGLGTLICALGLGPFIQFFDKHISEKLCGTAGNE